MMGLVELSDALKWLVPGYSWASTVAACVVLTILSGWYAGMETGLYRFHRLQGKLRARSGDPAARSLEELFADQRLLISVFLIGTNLWHYLAASVAAYYFTHSGRSEYEAEFFTSVTLTPALFIFGETIPKAWFYRRPNVLMLHSRKVIAVSYWLIRLSGVGFVLKLLTTAMLRIAQGFGPARTMTGTSDELTDLLRESHAEGALSPVQADIAERILELPEVRIVRVMTPLQRVVSLPVDVSRDQFLETVRRHPFTDLPLYEGDKRAIVGTVNTDVIAAEGESRPKQRIQVVLKLPAATSMLEALNTMQKQRARMAIITDPQDRAIGLVTVADLVKYLLGR